MADNLNLRAALALAERGIAVFPCRPDKRPQIGLRWKEEASADAGRIAAWWRRYPDALPAFEPGRHGMLVIDLDGEIGAADWDALAAGHGEIAAPFIVTPSGGRHIFFGNPDNLTNARGALPKKRKDAAGKDAGIDVRGKGGYVVAEGAVLPDGRSYTAGAGDAGLLNALDGDGVPPLPAWLATILTDAPAPDRPAPILAPARVATTSRGGGQSDFFRKVNDAALARLDAWVPSLFPRARPQPGTGAWRISSRDLGRNLQEDLSIAPTGIMDFGVHDMGDAQGGKRTAIDIVMEHGGAPDAVAAAKWLCGELGLDPDAMWQRGDADATPLPPINGKAAPGVVVADDEPDDEDDDEESAPLDEALTHVPGVLGMVVDWITDCGSTGNRILALSAALPFMATLLGRKMATPTRSGGSLELYVITTMESGGGKSDSMNAITRLMEKLNLSNQHLAAEFASGPAIDRHICAKPLSLSLIDEVSTFLDIIFNGKGHSQQIGSTMMKVWGKGFNVYRTDESMGRSAMSVHCPHWSLYGMTTPDDLFRVVKTREVTSGFINRFMIIDGGKKSKQKPKLYYRNPPEQLLRELMGLYQMGIVGKGNIGTINDKNLAPDPDPVQVPWANAEAEQAFDAFEDQCSNIVSSLDVMGKLYARTAFMAIKLATIRACSEYSPVTVEHVKWGAAIARQSADSLYDEIGSKMSEQLNFVEMRDKLKRQFLHPTPRGKEEMKKYGKNTLPLSFLDDNLGRYFLGHFGGLSNVINEMEKFGIVERIRICNPDTNRHVMCLHYIRPK